jgi:hypothetical protein
VSCTYQDALYHSATLPTVKFLETGSLYIAQAGLELMILLPHPAKCWDYGHAPPCLAFFLVIVQSERFHYDIFILAC